MFGVCTRGSSPELTLHPVLALAAPLHSPAPPSPLCPSPSGSAPSGTRNLDTGGMFGKASAGVADPGLTVNHQLLTARGCRSSEWVREQLWGGTAGEPQPMPGCSHPLQKPLRSLWEPGLCSDWEGRKLLPQLPGFLTGSVPASGFHSRNKSPAQYFMSV